LWREREKGAGKGGEGNEKRGGERNLRKRKGKGMKGGGRMIPGP